MAIIYDYGRGSGGKVFFFDFFFRREVKKINPLFSILLAVVIINCALLTMVARTASIDDGSHQYHPNALITSLVTIL